VEVKLQKLADAFVRRGKMIDHVVLNVRDLASSRKFYEQSLAPLGYTALKSFPDWVGFGRDGKADFWITRRDLVNTGVHLALRCDKRKQVDEFHAAAVKAGGKDNGKPGIRKDYHPNYYGAFAFDPDGNNIEAVCHEPQG
jgi:catechol 2,3-dioxygenase-like lactoylglutathione lyase family enzyme